MAVSKLEQELACDDNHAQALEHVLQMIDNPARSDEDRLRLVLLYALKYEREKNQLATLKSLLRDKAQSDKARDLVSGIDTMLNICGARARGGKSYLF